jgi:hypothetical protein
MRFDQFDAAFEASEQLLPDGTHECEIVKTKHWRSQDQSREAFIVTLKPVQDGFTNVEKWLNPAEQRDHKTAMQLADALGIARDAELDDALVGRRVMVVAKQGVSKKTGEAVVYVNGFVAGPDAPAWEQPAQVEAKRPAARTQAAKAHRDVTEGDPDVIPF